MRNLYDIVERLKYINLADRKSLLDEVKIISSEYVKRLDEIRRQGLDEGLQLDRDNYLKLNQDILGKIALIEQRMYQIRNNDLDGEFINQQYQTLTNAIDTCYGDDEKVVGEVISKSKKPEYKK